MERHGIHQARVPGEREQFLAGVPIPDLHVVKILFMTADSPGEPLAVRAKGRAGDGLGTLAVGLQELAAGGIPDPHGSTVLAGSEDAAIVTESHAGPVG